MSFRTVALSLVLSAFSLPGFGQTPEPALDSMAQRVQPCTACHGEEGRATPEGYFPRIAGKPAEYLFNQLTGFRDGRRFFPIMTFFVERQGDEYLRAMSEYFANIKLPYAPPVRASANESTLARGRRVGQLDEHSVLQVVPRGAAHGRAARHACSAWTFAGLPARPARRLAERNAPRARAGLHGPHRPGTHLRGQSRRDRVALIAGSARGRRA
jgi:cytochrome c553